MALRPFFESQDEIPAELREHYAPDASGERYVLQVAGADGWAVEDVAGLKSALGKLKDRAAQAESRVKRFETALGENAADPEAL